MIDFGIKDIIDILLVGLMLFYLYRMMRNSGTLSLFYGVLAFIVIWVVAYEIFDMRLTGTILDKFMNIGLIVLVILFQEQIKRFLIDIGSQGKWKIFKRLFRHEKRGRTCAFGSDGRGLRMHEHVEIEDRRTDSMATRDASRRLREDGRHD